MSERMDQYKLMDDETRRKVFWSLKRLTSYALWEKKKNAWERFALAYEEAVKTWPEEQHEQMPAENLPRIYEILSLYNSGLRELGRGNRFIWRLNGVFDRLIGEYYVVAAFLYPDGDYWERGIQEAPYPPKVETLNILMRASEYLGEVAPLEVSQAGNRRALIESPGWLLDPDVYRHRFYSLQYPVFPESLPPVPDPKGGVVRSGQTIPVDGIWEPVKTKRGRLLGLIPIGEAELESTGCLNYFVEGARAPRITGDYDQARDRYDFVDTHWRLVWEDDRYKDGIIPDESEYFIEPKAPVESLDIEPVREFRTNEICPVSGLWQAVGYKNPPSRIEAGAVMPDLSVRDAKGEMILHYVRWRLVTRD
ncbi:MAG: hypothetical protein KGQ57_13275 [Burkholderiales bacterium]|nr:hypothetical protein [Burkholderiales bacterium]